MGFLGKSNGGSAVGIDIGSSLIKVVEAKPGSGGVTITALGVAPTPRGSIDNEVIVDPQAVGGAIRQLLAESGISSKQSVSSVSGQSSVVVRIIEVPKMTKQELAETMKWEVERHVPFAASEVLMDFQPVERPTSSPDDQNMEVLLAVAQQEVVNGHVEALLAAGLEPIVIDVEPLAACRSLIDVSTDGAREQAIAIINIGAATTELGVYQSGLLAFPRTLPIAGDTITRALSDGLGISIQQAERLKRERAVVLLDRAEEFSASVGIPDIPAVGAYDEPEGALGASSPEAEAAVDDSAFIPGLGYGVSVSPPEEEKAEAGGELDFDIDIGGGAQEPGGPIMDFDLSGGDEEATVAPEGELLEGGPEAPRPAEGEAEVQDLPAPVAYDLSAVEEISEVELAEFSEEAIFDAMAPVLNDLIAEIRRSIEYYTSRFQSQPDRVLICGGTAKLKDLDSLLQTELGLPVIVANPLQNVTVFSKALSQDYLEEVAAVFPISVGLAIRDMIGE